MRLFQLVNLAHDDMWTKESEDSLWKRHPTIAKCKQAFLGPLTPVVRSFVRYAPFRMGKSLIYNRYFWPPRDYVARTKHGFSVSGNSRDLIQGYLYFFGTWEPNLTSFLCSRLKPGDVFIDVGANIGFFSLLASRCVGVGGDVIAIEAAPSTYVLLQNNIALNGATNINTINCAVYDKNATLQFEVGAPENLGQAKIVRESGDDARTIEVKAAPLGDIIDPDKWARARVLKIDVEGAEFEVFTGLLPLLAHRCSDLEIVIEVWPRHLQSLGHDPDKIIASAREYGLFCYGIRNEYNPKHYVDRRSNSPIQRVMGSIRDQGQMDLILSPIDTSALASQ